MQPRLLLTAVVATLLTTHVGHAGRQEAFVSRDSLHSRTVTTWEGSYSFAEEKVLPIQGLKPLHVLLYKRADAESVLIEFAVETSGGLSLLREADTATKGVTPALEGIDVIAGDQTAEIIVRWRHPGEGGLRSVMKYRYSSTEFTLAARSDLVTDGRGLKWVKAGAAVTSTPARRVTSDQNPAGTRP